MTTHEIADYLASGRLDPSREDALRILRHAESCEPCAEQLVQHPLEAEAVIQASQFVSLEPEAETSLIGYEEEMRIATLEALADLRPSLGDRQFEELARPLNKAEIRR